MRYRIWVAWEARRLMCRGLRAGRGREMQASRRDVFTVACVLGADAALRAAIAPAAAEPADERPKEGDYLVATDAANPDGLSARDIAGPPVVAWPMEPTTKLIRNGSRLNKVLLVRLDPATLVGATRERAADGVVGDLSACGLRSERLVRRAEDHRMPMSQFEVQSARGGGDH